jgi:hypothetical protein
MAETSIRVGDQVVNLQMPGVFRVTSRSGRLVVIESPGGVRLTVYAEGVRRLDGGATAPKAV